MVVAYRAKHSLNSFILVGTKDEITFMLTKTAKCVVDYQLLTAEDKAEIEAVVKDKFNGEARGYNNSGNGLFKINHFIKHCQKMPDGYKVWVRKERIRKALK